MDRFTDSFILNRTSCCFNTKNAFEMLPSIVDGRSINAVIMLQDSLLDLIPNCSSYKL